MKTIPIKPTRQPDLKNINVAIPRDKPATINGASNGSGKSTHAFDTIYAEGQRRFA
jgi:excinuclease ABC subunit A